jgi:hypothetical protein
MTFFNAKRVFLIVGAIVGILTVVITGFLYAGGMISFDSGNSLYQGFVDERYLTSSAISVKGEPLDADTLEVLSDTENVKVLPDATGDPAEGDAEDPAEGDEADTTTPESIKVRVLLFLESGELVASGLAFDTNNKFSLVKIFDMMGIKSASDLPHMNRERDILTYNDVDAVLAGGGYFRLENDGRYITRRIVPKISVLIE